MCLCPWNHHRRQSFYNAPASAPPSPLTLKPAALPASASDLLPPQLAAGHLGSRWSVELWCSDGLIIQDDGLLPIRGKRGYAHWRSGIVMMPCWSLMVAPEVVSMTTYGVKSNGNVNILTTPQFAVQCIPKYRPLGLLCFGMVCYNFSVDCCEGAAQIFRGRATTPRPCT